MFETVSYVFETYGWYLFGFTVVGFIVYRKYVKPSIDSYFARKHDEDIKKFDAVSRDKYSDKLKQARERQYQEFVKDQEKAKKKMEDRQREVEEEALRVRAQTEKGKKLVEIAAQAGASDREEDPDEFVATKITGKKVVVFSKKTCPFCMKAKQALSVYRIPASNYEIIELDDYSAKFTEKVQAVLGELTGSSSVPRVFIDGDCIGGGDDTVQALSSGKLAKMLKAAGAI